MLLCLIPRKSILSFWEKCKLWTQIMFSFNKSWKCFVAFLMSKKFHAAYSSNWLRHCVIYSKMYGCIMWPGDSLRMSVSITLLLVTTDQSLKHIYFIAASSVLGLNFILLLIIILNSDVSNIQFGLEIYDLFSCKVTLALSIHSFIS